MPSDSSSELKTEIGHVLFIDIVGYSKLLINEQTELLEHLKGMVRGSEQVRAAEAEGRLIRLATGDGMALVFRNSPEAPAQCALELSCADKQHLELELRTEIHSEPINEATDVNERANVTGAGVNMAQRVMDCGDAGHLLLSKRVADDLAQYRHWQPLLHELGECEVKHGVRRSVFNLYQDDLGNRERPKKLQRQKALRSELIAIDQKSLAVLPPPLSPKVSDSLTGGHMKAGKWDDAIAQGKRTLELDPTYAYLDSTLANAYREKGLFDQAIALYQQGEQLTRAPSRGLGITYARAGKRREAEQILARFLAEREKKYISAAAIGLIYAALGNKDEAFRWLECAYDDHDAVLTTIAFYPGSQPLREEPRFIDLIKRVGLDPAKAIPRGAR